MELKLNSLIITKERLSAHSLNLELSQTEAKTDLRPNNSVTGRNAVFTPGQLTRNSILVERIKMVRIKRSQKDQWV